MAPIPAPSTGPGIPPEPGGRGALRERMTVPALAYGGILMAVMQTVVVPLLPDLPRLTGASPGAVSWTVTATLLSGAVLTPCWAAPATCTASGGSSSAPWR